MPPASPVPACSRGEVCTESTQTRRRSRDGPPVTFTASCVARASRSQQGEQGAQRVLGVPGAVGFAPDRDAVAAVRRAVEGDPELVVTAEAAVGDVDAEGVAGHHHLADVGPGHGYARLLDA